MWARSWPSCRPGDPAAWRPGDPATRRPGDPAAWRRGGPAAQTVYALFTRRPRDDAAILRPVRLMSHHYGEDVRASTPTQLGPPCDCGPQRPPARRLYRYLAERLGPDSTGSGHYTASAGHGEDSQSECAGGSAGGRRAAASRNCRLACREFAAPTLAGIVIFTKFLRFMLQNLRHVCTPDPRVMGMESLAAVSG